MDAAKIAWTAGIVAAGWTLIWWLVGIGPIPTVYELATWNIIAAGVFWGLSVMWRGYQRRRARMQAEWEFYREVARSRDEA